MDIIKWTDELSVGNERMDRQHKMLVDLINKLYHRISEGKGNDVVAPVLGNLVSYAEKHFRDEELLMKINHYRDLNAHEEEHADFFEQIMKFKEDFEVGKVELSEKIITFLKNWLKDHIMGTDKKYSSALQD